MATLIPIVFQNEEIIVVDKPIGISIHNAEDATNLLTVLGDQLAANHGHPKLFPVHRLDKETSGIQIFAFDSEAAATYATEFQTRTVLKKYVGVLRGSMLKEDGIWTQPISDKAEGRVNPAGLAKDRVHSETRFHRLKNSKYFTSCEFDLVTGRQHQIRKHAALAGHALVGDPRYGDKKYNLRMAEMYGDARMFLHCSQIEMLGRKFHSPVPAIFDRLFA